MEQKETQVQIMETKRLILRPWREEDAEALFRYAKDSQVGPPAGWAPHKTIEESREILKGILSEPETYAIVLKESGEAVGSIGLMIGERSHGSLPPDEGEIGYWIGVPFWGQGLFPEAVNRLIRHAFEDLGLSCLWCGFFDGNEKSRRVQEKCGFLYHHTIPVVELPQLGETRTEHISYLPREAYFAMNEDASRQTEEADSSSAPSSPYTMSRKQAHAAADRLFNLFFLVLGIILLLRLLGS